MTTQTHYISCWTHHVRDIVDISHRFIILAVLKCDPTFVTHASGQKRIISQWSSRDYCAVPRPCLHVNAPQINKANSERKGKGEQVLSLPDQMPYLTDLAIPVSPDQK
jgi:hypothetical protein